MSGVVVRGRVALLAAAVLAVGAGACGSPTAPPTTGATTPAAASPATAAPAGGLCPRLSPFVAADPARHEAAENLAVTRGGDVLTTLLDAGVVRERRADGVVVDHAVPVGPGGSVTGIAVDSADRAVVAVNSDSPSIAGLWQVADGEPTRVAALPVDALSNGVAVSTDARGDDTFYVADSRQGRILTATRGRPARTWSQDPALAPRPRPVTLPDGSTATLSAGANGVHVVGRQLYVSVSGQATIVRFAVPDEGPPGAPEVVVRDLYTDDFLVDPDGTVVAAANPDAIDATSVVAVAPDGRRTTLAGPADGLSTPSAVARLPDGGLLVSELGRFSRTPRSGVVRLDRAPCPP